MSIWKRIGGLIQNNGRLIVAITVLLMVVAFIGVTQLKSDNGYETMVSTSSDEYEAYDEFTDIFSSDTIIVLIEGQKTQDLIDPQNIAAMASIEDQLNENPSIVSAVGPAFLIRQATGYERLPTDDSVLQELMLDAQTDGVNSKFRSTFPDDHHAMIAINLDGQLEREDMLDLVDPVYEAVDEAGFKGVNPIVSGTPVSSKETADTQAKAMNVLLIVSVTLMLVILVIIFRVRNRFAWRWLPLGAVLVGLVYALGVLGFSGVAITTVTVSAIPVLIGLGADYAIQLHNRYDEEARRGETFSEAVMQTIRSIGPAVGSAIVIACLGFTGLFFSPVPMIKDFGLTLIIGVICCYVISIGFMMVVLYWNDRRKGAAPTSRDTVSPAADAEASYGFVEKGLNWLAPRVLIRPAIIIPIALILGISGMIVDGKIGTESDPVNFVSSDLDYVKDLQTLQDVVGGRSTASIFIQSNDVTDPETLAWMSALEKTIMKKQEGIAYSTKSLADLVESPETGLPKTSQEAKQILDGISPLIKRNSVNEDYTAANLVIGIRVLESDEIQQLKADLESYVTDPPDGVTASVTGTVILQDKIIDGLTSGREAMTIFGIIFVFCGLLILFRLRWVRALLASLPIVLIVGWSAIVMYLTGIKYTPVTSTTAALIVGIGVEFTILLLMRYYEEKDKGQSAAEAMTTAISKIGRAIIASGMTVIGGFGALLMAVDFPILQDFGIVTMINVVFALVSTLVVLPPLIVWVETRLPVRPTGAVAKRKQMEVEHVRVENE